ncbi:MAG: putative transcriptional activator SRCAP-like protein, partial [Pseudonocardiales bacterium]|nr:putative transcriptional activator SRCAP-like protein [Pseudonocardiales bacterium]
ALTGTPTPEFQLTLKGLHLPGAATSSDLAIGGPGVDIQDALLSLVLGLVRQGADALSGAAAAEVGAALDLLGIGGAAGIPPLPVAELVDQGVDRLRDWFVEVMGAAPARAAWLTALSQLLGGTVTGDHVAIQIGGGPVTATIGIRAATTPSGHLVVTPQLGLSLSSTVGTVRLGAEAVADLVAIDTATGALTPIPDAEIVVTAAGTGATKLLDTTTAKIGSVRLGLAVRGGDLHPLLALRAVEFGGHPPQDLDLSSPDAVVAAAGQVAATLLGDALDALGAAGTELKALLGLTGTGAMPALQAEHLLTDPLGTLATWWHDLLTTHQADVPAVLAHLCNLVAPAMPPPSVTGTGTAADPWSIPIVPKLTIDAWLDAGRLIVAPTLSLRSNNLAGDCTLVLTTVRMQLASIDLAGKHAQFPLAVDVTAKLRDRGNTEARLALGPVAIVADFIGVQARWSPAAGFGVDFLSPNLAIDTGQRRVPLVLPTLDANGHLDVPPAAWTSVEALLAVLAASAPTGWLADLADLTGWTLSGQAAGPRLSLAELVATPVPTLEAWLAALATDADLVGSLTATIAHLAGGSSDGLAGVFSGSGTPEDPWLAGLGRTSAAPAIAVWLSPHGPVLAATLAGEALHSWRPGMPGLPPEGLAQALFDEARSGPDVEALALGRDEIGSGLQSLAARWTGTDGMVAAPPAPIAGLSTVVRPDVSWRQLPEVVDLAEVVPGGVPAGAVVVRVYVTSAPFDPRTLPWDPAGRLLDLTGPALAAASFSVPAPAAGLWDVALAPRADAGLGNAADPAGLVGQSARLQQVLSQLAAAGPVVLVAFGGAGHAARMAADAVTGVTHLVTL